MEWGQAGEWSPLVERPMVDWGDVGERGFSRFGLQVYWIPFGIEVVRYFVAGLGPISVGF